MGKCRNYLAAISQSYCSSGLLSVFEDSLCSSILDMTLTLWFQIAVETQRASLIHQFSFGCVVRICCAFVSLVVMCLFAFVLQCVELS